MRFLSVACITGFKKTRNLKSGRPTLTPVQAHLKRAVAMFLHIMYQKQTILLKNKKTKKNSCSPVKIE